jgi:hypothetical protein
MRWEVGESLRSIVKRVFPEGARLVTTDSGGQLVMFVSWPLAGDPCRPARRSRSVRLVVTREMTERLRGLDEAARSAALVHLEAWLRERAAAFEPDHDAPRGVEPPVETWRLGPRELIGA